VKRPDVINDFVWQRQQLSAECIDHLAVCDFELRDIHQLVALLSQFEQLQLARDALGHRAFGHEVDAVFAAIAGGNTAQVIDVRQSDRVYRRGTPVDLQLAEMPGNGGLIEAEMLSDLCLCGHLYDPLARVVSTKRTGLELPAFVHFFRGPRQMRMPLSYGLSEPTRVSG
jgi:hypothetical protein